MGWVTSPQALLCSCHGPTAPAGKIDNPQMRIRRVDGTGREGTISYLSDLTQSITCEDQLSGADAATLSSLFHDTPALKKLSFRSFLRHSTAVTSTQNFRWGNLRTVSLRGFLSDVDAARSVVTALTHITTLRLEEPSSRSWSLPPPEHGNHYIFPHLWGLCVDQFLEETTVLSHIIAPCLSVLKLHGVDLRSLSAFITRSYCLDDGGACRIQHLCLDVHRGQVSQFAEILHSVTALRILKIWFYGCTASHASQILQKITHSNFPSLRAIQITAGNFDDEEITSVVDSIADFLTRTFLATYGLHDVAPLDDPHEGNRRFLWIFPTSFDITEKIEDVLQLLREVILQTHLADGSFWDVDVGTRSEFYLPVESLLGGQWTNFLPNSILCRTERALAVLEREVDEER